MVRRRGEGWEAEGGRCRLMRLGWEECESHRWMATMMMSFQTKGSAPHAFRRHGNSGDFDDGFALGSVFLCSVVSR